jgi:AbrB family looped-hinge helix DNA binding protein
MSVVKVGPRRQITIPKEIYKEFHLEEGDYIEAKAEDQRIVLVPKTIVARPNVVSLNKEEQNRLKKTKAKMERIRRNFAHSKGLTKREINVAVKAGLIDPEQTWWWTEEWQKGEREAEKEIREGKLLGPFSTVEHFKNAIES